jgi:hypothetical protein
MSNRNEKKNAQLGMSYGTATARLRKLVLFDLLKRHGENICYRCNEPIETVEELSMDHKEPWLGNDTALFWDVENIAFAHLSCNCLTTSQRPVRFCPKGHDTHKVGRMAGGYCRGCRFPTVGARSLKA